MAEALLRRHLAEAGIAAEVRSAGTLGWNDRPATDHAVTVMAELGLDIGAHTSRRLAPELLHADLVVTMTRDPAGAVLARDPELRSRVPSRRARMPLVRTRARARVRMRRAAGVRLAILSLVPAKTLTLGRGSPGS